MIFWGLADFSVVEVVEVYPSREDAERTHCTVLGDEPQWEGMLAVLSVTLYEFCPN
jgi:hypothetical protein